MTTIRAAAVQISPVLFSREGTVDKVVQKIIESDARACSSLPLVRHWCVLPVLFLCTAAFRDRADHVKLMDEAVTVPSAATLAICEACKRAKSVVSIGINEREGGTLYNTQLLFDADDALNQRRRKMTPTYHERMIWGQGDASGLQAVNSAAGRIRQLACWEHYNPLARYAMMADGEQIHSAMYPGSFGGDLFSEQTEINTRQHALEAGCFVVCATAWLDQDQQAQIMRDTGCPAGPISSGCFTAIISPHGELLGKPLRSGEGVVISDLTFALIDEPKRLMDCYGHYGRPELLSLSIDRTPAAYVHACSTKSALRVSEEAVTLPGPTPNGSQPSRATTSSPKYSFEGQE